MALKYIKYLMIPQVNKGRDFNGVDCFGLVRLFYKEEFGIELKDYIEYSDQWWKENPALIAKSYKAAGFVKRKHFRNLQHGDAVLMKEEGELKHLGVYVDPGYVIHTQDSGTYCEPLSKMGYRIIAAYYYKGGLNAPAA